MAARLRFVTATALMAVTLCMTAAPQPSGRKGPLAPASETAFAWGAETGPGIDMAGDDMSTLDIGAMVGMRCPYLSFLGAGAGINFMISNSCRTFPVYLMARTSFSRRPQLFFAEMRGGVAFNQADGVPDRTNLYLRPGVGIHLATGASFSSYLSLSYTYNAMTFYGNRDGALVHGLNMATIALGVIF